MNEAYLLIDIFTIIVPLLFSFHKDLLFYRTWKAFFPAVIASGVVFIAWDIYFTYIGVWGFNPNYLLGLNIINLPVEEIFFFFCIPYSCVFTFYCINIYIKKKPSLRAENIITFTLIIGLIIIEIIFRNKKYTSVAFLFLILLLVFCKYFLKITWLGKFYIVYGILLFPFLIVNGILTGTGLNSPIVWYNQAEITGARILTIPVEDIFYGMDLILLNLLIYKYFYKKLGYS